MDSLAQVKLSVHKSNNMLSSTELKEVKRQLGLRVKVTIKYGGVVVISVFAPLLNCQQDWDGLPMLFKQEGDAAGQFEEHELARMMATLLLSFAERFQLYNQSQHKIQFAELGFATTFVCVHTPAWYS